jgi:hypothetical protein
MATPKKIRMTAAVKLNFGAGRRLKGNLILVYWSAEGVPTQETDKHEPQQPVTGPTPSPSIPIRTVIPEHAKEQAQQKQNPECYSQ